MVTPEPPVMQVNIQKSQVLNTYMYFNSFLTERPIHHAGYTNEKDNLSACLSLLCCRLQLQPLEFNGSQS